ncbi:uncharacterized protein K452DRAFT_250940 [Aplosporella prunicola CBS 121167]|uniref:ABC transporter domain-containing protein n=1 Tax=Aplosporella prunicola CBS 121167 TaxID=1176127 RepID=A0A6A6BC86_9PEZI|nr:uncharacterized protein K452DRAFT_250940 [Aplosporella prunicola CBS 121167]KAF2141198.1 hypothetical protein K452DRAFT_250940 [Aplosporella prunicola CBS 121167]
MIYISTSLCVWGFMTVSFSSPPMWHVYLGTWLLSTVLDITLFGLSVTTYDWNDPWNVALASIQLVRLILLITLLLAVIFRLNTSMDLKDSIGEESQPLMRDGYDGMDSSSQANVPYGTLNSSSTTLSTDDEDEDEDEDEDDRKMRKIQKRRLEEQGGWWGYLKGFKILLPYIWPSNNRRMQLWLVVMGLSIAAERVFNVLIPRQMGIIVDALAKTSTTGYFPWKELLIWAALHIINVSAGYELFKSLASFRISSYAYRQLTAAAFKHVMSLSMDYHTGKSTGDLLKAIEQGSDINSILEAFLFQGGPLIIDLIVAAVYLSSVFDVYMAFIIAITTGSYIYLGIQGTKYLNPKRRDHNAKSRKENEILYDSVSNWQTVSYHNQHKFEQERYAKAVEANTTADLAYWDSFSYIESAQSFIMILGLLVASFFAASRIYTGIAPIGDFVLLVTYWNSIESPLGNLIFTFRQTASHFISAERLLELLQTKPTVADKTNAKDLELKDGRVEFSGVSFAYDARKPILKDLSVAVEPGQTVALVGETGGGKSTTFKLLMRFYDVASGSVRIDGQDVRDVTLSSVRAAFGVVPQDPSLFNDTIMNNIRYACPGAPDEAVFAACKAAAIHDKILSFADGYASKIGERGVRLSGGELQRVAIAQVILKAPKIVLLDEATSAVDSSTEKEIQEAFRRLSKGRTTFVIAHRLSTVMHADLILVINDGRIVERGSHAELLEMKGEYHALWSKNTGDI